jgi:hypothetical protein
VKGTKPPWPPLELLELDELLLLEPEAPDEELLELELLELDEELLALEPLEDELLELELLDDELEVLELELLELELDDVELEELLELELDDVELEELLELELELSLVPLPSAVTTSSGGTVASMPPSSPGTTTSSEGADASTPIVASRPFPPLAGTEDESPTSVQAPRTTASAVAARIGKDDARFIGKGRGWASWAISVHRPTQGPGAIDRPGSWR